MSKIGKIPVKIPEGVTVSINGDVINVKGKLGELSYQYKPSSVEVKISDNQVSVNCIKDDYESSALWGTTRAHINNMIHGVSVGWTKELELKGVGYKVSMKGTDLLLNLGFSHDVIHVIPAGVKAETPSATEIKLTSIDKQKVGQVASDIRNYRRPEPYKGKGIRYKGEYVRRLEGKKK